jgi:hypothetical protein
MNSISDGFIQQCLIWVLLSKKGQGYLKWLEGLKVFGHASEATLC